jgi:hypothetical protein
MQHQFAESAQDQKHEATADPVNHEQTGPCGCQPCSGAHEQPSPDGAADRDHLHLAVAEIVVITRVFASQRSGIIARSGAGRAGRRRH